MRNILEIKMKNDNNFINYSLIILNLVKVCMIHNQFFNLIFYFDSNEVRPYED